ncbi:MAG: CPBP family intramembrane metalloprotease [Bacteroides sp.]|nr:CPBP family intramembrane metalloprotease [Bacteroides sp.]MCM1549310.1 CPBP family intramembrane metalloprotease [Clostridium sp.]
MDKYIKKNIVPIMIELVFIISCFIVPKEYFIYTNCVFYILLLIYFVAAKDFSMKEWLENLKSGKSFWKQVMVTALFFVISFIITIILENIFPDFNTGTITLRRDSVPKLIIFAISTILLPAITEETFFRKNMISFKNKSMLIMTTIFSMFLYSLEHSLSIWGIFLTMIWALPLSISYIKTKNIYVPMTAHFIGNLFGNGIDVVMTFFQLVWS